MRRRESNVLRVLVVTWVMILVMPLAAMAAETVTIAGEVNDSYQLVDSQGQVFEIVDTAKGNDLVENHIGEKAKVTGTVEQDQDVKILTVTTFKIVDE